MPADDVGPHMPSEVPTDVRPDPLVESDPDTDPDGPTLPPSDAPFDSTDITQPPRRQLLRRALGAVARVVRATLFAIVLACLALLFLLVGWLQSPDFQRRSTSLIELVVEDATGEEITLNRVRVKLWPPAVEAEGVHLFNGTTGDTIVSAERVRIPLVLRAGGPRIGRLGLQRPVVHLHLDAQGKLREFSDMRRPAPDQRKPLERLPWSSLHVTDGEIVLDIPDGSVRLDGIELMPTAGTRMDLRATLTTTYRDFEEKTPITWTGVRAGDTIIDVPSLVVISDTLSLQGDALWPLGEDLDVNLQARIELDGITPLLSAPRAAHGVTDIDLRVEGPVDDPVLLTSIHGTELGLDMPGVFTPLLTYNLGDITATARITKQAAEIEQVVLHWGGGEVVAWGTVHADKTLTDAHVTGSDVSLAWLLEAFDAAPTPWVDMGTDLEIVAAGDLDPLRLEGTFDLSMADLRVGDRPIGDPNVQEHLEIAHGHARGTVLLERDHLYLEAPTVQGPRSAGSMTMDIGFGPRGPLDLQATLHAVDLADFQPLNDVDLQGTGWISGRIWGPFNRLQFDGEGDVQDFSVLGISYADDLQAVIRSPDMKSLELTEAHARVGSSTYGGRYAIDFRSPVSMDTAIVIDQGRVEDLVHMFVDVDGLTGDLTGSLVLSGPIYDMNGAAHFDLSDAGLYGESFPTGHARGFMDAGRFTLDELQVRRDDGRAGLTLRGSVEREWELDMELIADGLTLQELDRLNQYDLPLMGKVSAYSRITHTLFEPSPAGRISIHDVRYAGEAIDDSVVDFVSDDGVAEFTGSLFGGTADVTGTLGLWDQQPYALSIVLDDLPVHRFYPEAIDGSPIRAMTSGEVAISGHFGPEWSPVELRSVLDEVEVGYRTHTLRNTGPWRYEQDGKRFRLTGMSLQGGRTDVQLSASGGESLLLAGDGTVDLDLLRAVVPGLQRATGQAEVVLYAVGTKPEVEAVVDLEVDAELLRHSAVPVGLEDTRARIQVRQDRIDIVEVAGGIGGGEFTGSGQIEAVDWVPIRYDLAMEVSDAQVQWVEALPPAIGDASLTFDGPAGALLLAGEVDVQDMTFSDRIDWEDWVVEYREQMLVDPAVTYDGEPMFNLNVAVTADRSIFLRNNVAEGIASAELRVIGDTVRPGLVGTVHVEQGLAFLQDREFRFDRGNLLFNDPWSWDPELDLSLLTDIDSRDQRYRVNYMIFGPFSNWRTTTRSDPSLAQSDVNALLWFGVTTDELEEMGELSTAVGLGVADLMLTDFLISGQAGEIGEDIPEFLFDRIDLATGVNARGEYSPEPRLVVEKRVADLNDLDLTWEFNLVRPDDNYFSAEQRIGGIWSLSGWYATQQRDRVLPIGGAYGVDATARWEIE